MRGLCLDQLAALLINLRSHPEEKQANNLLIILGYWCWLSKDNLSVVDSGVFSEIKIKHWEISTEAPKRDIATIIFTVSSAFKK